MITAKNIVRHELIGLGAKIYGQKNKGEIKGTIIDETQKTLTLRTKKGQKTIIKNESVLEIQLPNKQKVIINGKIIYGRSEDRLKKKLPKKWDVL